MIRNTVQQRESYDLSPAKALLAKHRALTYPYLCTFGEAKLEISDGVFCPTLTNVSPFLLKNVDFKSDEKVLDAFAGSGAFGINAALKGASVVAFDISTDAVACIRENARRNGVSKYVDVRLGTLTKTVFPDEKFDLIIANPPLLPGIPDEDKGLEAALFDEDLHATKGFVTALPNLLSRKGRCYLLTSDVIERGECEYDICEICRQLNLEISTVAELRLEYETYRIHKITKPSSHTL